MGGTCSAHGGDVKCIRNFGSSLQGKRPLRRPKSRWEDNIKKNLREIGFEGVDWIHLAQDRNQWRALVNTVMNSRIL
jgi:ribosome biogenesis protein Nip4